MQGPPAGLWKESGPSWAHSRGACRVTVWGSSYEEQNMLTHVLFHSVSRDWFPGPVPAPEAGGSGCLTLLSCPHRVEVAGCAQVTKI